MAEDNIFPRRELGDTSFSIPQDPTGSFEDFNENLDPVSKPQKVSQEVLDALSKPQDPSKIIDDNVNVNSILDVKETLNERLNRMSSPHFEADFGDKDLSREDFFPTIDRKILAGQSTNDFVGTQPIFVGEGALFPFAIQQSRQKALSKAAEKRAAVRKKVRKLTEMHAVAQYDEEFQGMVSGLLEEFGEKSGWRLEDLADSRNEMGREFFKRLNKLKVLRNDLTAADTKAREVRKTFTDPKTFTPESVLESTRKIIAGQGDLEGMLNSKNKRAEFYEGVSKLTSYENATKFLDSRFEGTKIGQDLSSELERNLAEILEGTNKELQNNIIRKWASEESDQVIEVTKSIIPKGRVESLVRTAVKNSNVYKGEDLKTDTERESLIQEYIDYVYNKLGQSLKTKVTFPRIRPKKDDDSGGSKTKKPKTTLWTNIHNKAINKDNKQVSIGEIKNTNTSVENITDPVVKQNLRNEGYAQALNKGTDATFNPNRKDGKVIGKIPLLRSDLLMDRTVSDSKFELNGSFITPEEYIERVRELGEDAGPVEESTYAIITGKDWSNRSSEDVVKGNRSSFAKTNGQGLVTGQELVYRVLDEETGNLRSLTYDDLERNPELINEARTIVRISFRAKEFARQGEQDVNSRFDEEKKKAWVDNHNVANSVIELQLDNLTHMTQLDSWMNTANSLLLKAQEKFKEEGVSENSSTSTDTENTEAETEVDLTKR